MKQAEAIQRLAYWDKKGRYVFRKQDLSIVFDEMGKTFDQTLARLVKSGVLQRAAYGVYVFAASRHIGVATIEHIARNLRRGHIIYESLESALSQYGVISQIPIDRITLMTTGRSGEYHTPYGVIEFTHTKVHPNTLAAHLIQRSERLLPIATKHYSYANLQSVGRNLDMVDKEELYDEV
jgi:predicted transcriptional regulator of viral defense system